MLDLPASLDTILLRALSANPEDRYTDLAELTSYLLPFASPRATRHYRTLSNQESGEWRPTSERPQASEITGDFTFRSTKRQRLVDPSATTDYPPAKYPTPTVVNKIPFGLREDALDTATFRPPERRASATFQWVALSVVLAIAAGIGAWALRSRTVGPQPPALVADPVPASPASGTAGVAPTVAPAGRAEGVPTRIVVVAFPSDAVVELDGVVMGQGSLDHTLVLDGRAHRLAVSAPGYEPQSLTFSTQVPPARIELSRARRRSSSMASPHTSPAAEEPHVPSRRPADHELRDER